MIPHSRPTLGAQDQAALAAVMASGQVAQGPRVREFEEAVARAIGEAGGVAVHSGTAAVELALLAMGVGSGDEVILPSYLCSGPWLAVLRVGAQPTVVDIDPATYALDPSAVAKAITPRTRAILVPHLFGLPADLGALEALGLPLIEDCAQTLGATESGRRVGTVGVVAVCSFYATKLLCTGEGGMVVSGDWTVLETARRLREYDGDPVLRPKAFNRKMTDLQAALGLSQLAQLPAFLDRRAAIASLYATLLTHPGLERPATPPGRSHIYYRYVVRVRRPRPSLDDLLARLERRGVQCRRPVFLPLHRYLGLAGYPFSEEAHETALSLPIYPSLTDDEAASAARALCEELG